VLDSEEVTKMSVKLMLFEQGTKTLYENGQEDQASVMRGGALGSEMGQTLRQCAPCPLEWTPYLS